MAQDTSTELPVKVFEGFLSPEKCESIITNYADKCTRSTVILKGTNDTGTDPGRTSSTFFLPDTDPIIVELRKRAARLCGLPENNVEGLQLVRYAKGEQYKYHYDYFEQISDNQRAHTFLVYLNDLSMEDGGSTMFHHYNMKVYPKTGRCVWFTNMHPDGAVNTESMHAGEAIQSDKIKYAINIWIREKGLNTYPNAETPTAAGPIGFTQGSQKRGVVESPWLFILLICLLVLVYVAAGYMYGFARVHASIVRFTGRFYKA